MTDFGAIDALLASTKKEVALPPAEERRTLREELSLSRAQLAQALGVSPSTVGGWESGRDPSGETREKYAYFLGAAKAKLAAEAAKSTDAAGEAPAEEPEDEVRADAEQAPSQDDNVDVLAVPQPCVLCGQMARQQVAGFPQHLDPAECNVAEPAQTSEPAEPAKPAPRPEPRRAQPSGPQGQAGRGVRVVPAGRRMQTADSPDLIGSAVTAALAEHSG
ncbi:helix-turn-helix transcriptional regulator [Streptomyces coacervatus]|uniref:helix-turn-helix domain-containing protein n=1 Tax=Streptomyces coacervatus TaxID=647381 RepID=UPI0023DA9D48|nr:helix-turn-helix transcriptional regulator [Streptomyces coacervatus]MDF2273414.1 helix-turn-helix transcriptional regulator [Streptomyces coacervatus]